MDQFSLQELVGFFVRNLRTLGLGVIGGAFLGLIVAFWQQPLFVSEATLQFSTAKEAPTSLDSMFTMNRTSSANSATPILQSRRLAEEVVKKLALNAVLTNLTDATFGKVLRRKVKQWINPPPTPDIQGLSGKARYFLASLLGNPGAFGFITISDLKLDPFLASRELTLVLLEDSSGLDVFDESETLLTRCPAKGVCRVALGGGEISFVTRRIVPGYHSKINMKFQSLDKAAANLRSSISVQSLGRALDDFLQVRCKWPDPYQAARILELLAQAYGERDRSAASRSYDQMIDFLEQHLAPTEAKLEQAEKELRAFLRAQHVIDMPAQYQQGLQSIAGFEQQRLDVELKGRELSYLATVLDGADRIAYGALISQVSEGLADEWQKLQEKSVELNFEGENLNGFTEKYPPMKKHLLAVKRLQQSQDVLKRKALKVIQEQQKMLLQKDAVIRSSIEKVEKGMVLDSGPQSEYLRLQRNKDVAEKLYGMILEKREEMRLTRAGETASMHVLDTPLVGRQVSPNLLLNLLLGGFLGFLSLGVWVFLRESLDTAVKTPDELEKLGLYVHGMIPIHKEAQESEGLVTMTRPTSVDAEAYRSLRTSIQLSSLENHIRSIMITSSGPGEGKSTTLVNLAVTLAQAGNRTLVVDCDMRRPVIDSYLSVEREPGLSEILNGKLDWREYVKPTTVDGLFALPAGSIPTNPSELVGRVHMATILSEMKQEYDFVLCDVPPILVVSDAALLASHLDAVLILIRAGRDSAHDIARAREQMERVGGNVLGAVFNAFDGKESGYGYSNYRHVGYYQQDQGNDTRSGWRKRIDSALDRFKKH